MNISILAFNCKEKLPVIKNMRLKDSIGLLMICFVFGCSIFKKDKAPVNATVNVVNVDSSTVDSLIKPDSSAIVMTDTVVAPPPPPKQPLEYMTIEEKAMIDEINLLRADPNTYIQYIDAYLKDFLADDNFDFSSKQVELSAGEELIRELKFMPPLPLLKPSEALYKVAMKHGKDMKKNGTIRHRGSDGSFPEDRIRDSTNLAGSENLAAGAKSVRESVIMLLVDANDKVTRGHRKTILNPLWEYTACYAAGTIDEVPNTWVQLFGYKDPNEIPKDLPVRSVPVAESPQPISEATGETESTTVTEIAEKKENTSTPQASGDYSFMSTLEKSMIDEINLMRSNPKGYVKLLEDYVIEEKKVMIMVGPDFDVAVNELKSQLRSMAPLSILKPHKKLYEVAKAHGIDNKNHHQIEHTGSDGRSSFQRVKDSGLNNSITYESGQGNYAPNENLATGTKDITVREIVMTLLIDAGISTRGHRKALLEPTWEYVACYHIDLITSLKDYVEAGMEDTDAPNCWVQFFAKS